MTVPSRQRWVLGILIAVTVFAGVAMRFIHITDSDFVFYDEGYYLNYNRYFYDLLERDYPHTLSGILLAVSFWFRLSLGCGKALWFLLSDARVFFGGYRCWFFPRILAAVSGTLTLGAVYLFARRYFDSKKIGLLSLVLLAVLPSHVFYSRLALQETMSALFFLSGFYFYIFPRRFGPRTILSATLFAGAYFTNYRLVTLPVLVAFCELVLSLSERRMIDFRKYVWHTVTFLAYLVCIGALDQGQNTRVTFAWMFYQSNLAKKEFYWINFLSYPYYLFRLEHPLFGLFFFGNIFYIIRRRWTMLLPFSLAGLHMLIYSFAAEKGARYICVILPFAVMAVASLIVFLHETYPRRILRIVLWLLVAVMGLSLTVKSVKLARSHSDYRRAMAYLMARDKNAGIIATQNFILELYTRHREQVVALPYKFHNFLELYTTGYRYLVVDPQAYISFTYDGQRFNPQLHSYLSVIDRTVKPIKVFDNFSDVLMERFVFDHNEYLTRSIDFLKNNNGRANKLRIYDVRTCLAEINRRLGLQRIMHRMNPDYAPARETDRYGR